MWKVPGGFVFTFVHLDRTEMEPQIDCGENLVLSQWQINLELSSGGVMDTQVPLSQNLFFLLPASTRAGKASTLWFSHKQGH